MSFIIKAYAKTAQALIIFSDWLGVIDLVAIWICKVLKVKASNETLEAYYMIDTLCFDSHHSPMWIRKVLKLMNLSEMLEL